jgi:hypothetical protein
MTKTILAASVGFAAAGDATVGQNFVEIDSKLQQFKILNHFRNFLSLRSFLTKVSMLDGETVGLIPRGRRKKEPMANGKLLPARFRSNFFNKL